MVAVEEIEENQVTSPLEQDSEVNKARAPNSSSVQQTQLKNMEEKGDITNDKQQKAEAREEEELERQKHKMNADETCKSDKLKEAATDKKMPNMETSISKSFTKTKMDVANAAAEPSGKSKRARALALTNLPSSTKRTKKNSDSVGDFSFARPTASSARRTAAVAKATPPAAPTRKILHNKNSLDVVKRRPTPAPKTPVMADKKSRAQCSYTPYTGPLPPLNVQSSFAPKGSQTVFLEDRRATSASTKVVRKSRPAGKKNRRLSTCNDAATNVTFSSKANEGPIGVMSTDKTLLHLRRIND
ncbi:hypothetical protein CCR75_008038 [Bremia lactucae]|uniref:Uncharacterized protein n=1 Tax=Bremia lactucae TaxID=4779 RepID=A0A976FF51_BRELC|nr:hypothetical protein CCR75_008038 [Bremia lactucae]